MNENTTTANAKPMKFGRALHLDLSRASDDTLEAAFRVLDNYDTAGKASAYTEELIDERIAAIFDEQDRRAGQEPVFIPRQPGLRDQRPLHLRESAAASMGEEDDRAHEALTGPDSDADDASADIEREGDNVPVTTLLDTPDAESRDNAERSAREAFTQTYPDGLVPGEKSAI